MEMDFIVPRGSSLGLYARKNAIPTLTLNDIRDVLSGYRSNSEDTIRQTRSIVRKFTLNTNDLDMDPISIFCAL